MPLENAKPGTSGFGKNIATEINAGKDPKQAAAIAYSKAGEKKDDRSSYYVVRWLDKNNKEKTAQVLASSPDEAEKLLRRREGVLWGDIVDVKKDSARTHSRKDATQSEELRKQIKEGSWRGQDAQYTKREEIQNAEANLRYYKEELAKHERRAKSSNKDEAEDGVASVRWAKENIAKEERNLAKAKARQDAVRKDAEPKTTYKGCMITVSDEGFDGKATEQWSWSWDGPNKKFGMGQSTAATKDAAIAAAKKDIDAKRVGVAAANDKAKRK